MAKLKLGAIADDKPVKLTLEFPAALHRDLLAYADALARETGQPIADPLKPARPSPVAHFSMSDTREIRASQKPPTSIQCQRQRQRGS